MSDEYVLELEHIRKEFSGNPALKDVSLRLRRGEILGLIGENGAGKSTLIKCCSGAVVPTSGKIRINGRVFDRMTPRLSAENGIAVIYQEFNNVGELSAAENMFLGNPIRKGMLIDRKAMEAEAAKSFEHLGIRIDPRDLVKNLSVGYQQMIEIAKAIHRDAQVLIMDEPSAPLTDSEVKSLFSVIRLLKEKGVSIIYISHRLDEILQLTDRVEVIRDGEFIDLFDTKDATTERLIQCMVGREMTGKFPARENCIDQNKVVLELKNVSGNGDRDISFKIHAGEVLGLGGLIGAGRTELAEILFGVKPKESGQILLNGKEIHPKTPREAIDLGIALVPEDRKRHGLHMAGSVRTNINLPIYRRTSRGGVIDSGVEKRIAEKYRTELRIKCPSIELTAKNLSGGNQQKVILGKWLAADTQLFIFDEPTRGIDIGAKYEIYKLINALAQEGRCVLMISSEMEELIAMSDRIIVLAEHRVRGELQKEEFNAERIMAYASAAIDERD